MQAGLRTPLLERTRELRALTRAAEDVAAGDGPRLVLVEGAPGIGKTRLVAAARRQAHAAGFDVLAARPGPLDRALPWGAARELFGDLPSAPSAGAARSLEPAREAAARQALLLHAESRASSTPLALLVDDAHWADAPSLRLLTAIARSPRAPAILLVVATRPVVTAEADPALVALRCEPTAVVLAPQPLSVRAGATLLEATAGRLVDGELADACHRATGGNPLLLFELALDLPERAPDGALPAPDGVRRSVQLRLAALPPAAQAIARAVAVLGPRATLLRVRTLADVDAGEATAAVEALAVADLLVDAEPLEYVHPLAEAAVLDSLAPAAAAELHARAARMLDDPEEAALHLLRARPAGDPETVATLRAAAASAVERGAPDAAAALLRRALAEPVEPGPERAEVRHELGLRLAEEGEPEAVDHLRAALADAADAQARSIVASHLAGALMNLGRLGDAHAVLEAAIAELDPAGGAAAGRADAALDLRLRLEAGALEVAAYEPSLTPRRLDRVARLRSLSLQGVTPAERLVLGRLALEVAIGGGTAEEAHALARRALAGDLVADAGWGEAHTPHNAGHALIVIDRYDEAEEYFDHALARARRRGSRMGAAIARFRHAALLLRRGQVAASEEEARASVRRVEDAALAVQLPAALAFLAEALLERGALDEAAELCDRLVPGLSAGPLTPPQIRLLWVGARVRAARGDHETAVYDFATVGRLMAGSGVRWPTPWSWLSHEALSHLALGRDERARDVASEELRLARASGAPRALGIALRAYALTHRDEAAAREAVAALARAGAELEQARALVDLGVLVRREGRRSDALDHLREALELADRCGAEPVVTRAREELRATGARPRRAARHGPEALTPSELRVATLASGGRSNREIAAQLFVTVRTVELHLTATYEKLRISSRRELGEALRSLPKV
jgi:DNA-binding NarL/FixJ family response regulator